MDVCRALTLAPSSDWQRGGVITADTPTRNQFGARVIQAMTYIDKGGGFKTLLGKRDNKSRKADNLIREISQQNQYNKQ